MRHRPAFTLMEVLVAIFIMGIGMLALLTLFPLGAMNIARALRDDRTASAAALAENIALARDIRHDPLVVNAFVNPFPTQNQQYPPLPANWTGPSWPVYVDPYGALLGQSSIGANPSGSSPGLPRCNVSFVVNPAPYAISAQAANRWFALIDDITFQPNGVPDTSTGFIQRGENYTWAYLLRRPRAWSDAVTNLSVVVYSGRNTTVPNGENAFNATGSNGTNGLVVTWDPTTGQEKPAVKIGTWILDSTYDQITDPATGLSVKVAHGDFYRVVNVIEDDTTVPPSLQLELQTNLRVDLNPGTVTVMENVVEVFDKGDGWQP